MYPNTQKVVCYYRILIKFDFVFILTWQDIELLAAAAAPAWEYSRRARCSCDNQYILLSEVPADRVCSPIRVLKYKKYIMNIGVSILFAIIFRWTLNKYAIMRKNNLSSWNVNRSQTFYAFIYEDNNCIWNVQNLTICNITLVFCYIVSLKLRIIFLRVCAPSICKVK